MFSILQVEDNDDHAFLVARNLRQAISPYPELKRVCCLTEAYEVLEGDDFDLILLDLGLLESRGVETLRLLLERFPKLPIIVLTSNADECVGEEALRAGALDFLVKEEVTAASLRRSIRYARERWSYQRALDQSMNDMAQFARAAAHDLTSPLKTISGLCSYVEMNLAEANPDLEELRKHIGLLSMQSSKASKMVVDLLQFASLDGKGIVVSQHDLERVVCDVVESLDGSLKESGGLVRFAGNLCTANFNRGLIAHVFQNLISNAVKYRGSEAPVVTITCERGAHSITVSVADNGLGFKAEDADRIFNPFKRLKNSSGAEGTGLGLSICRRIIEAHKGRIWAESEVGVGSVFRFELPL